MSDSQDRMTSGAGRGEPEFFTVGPPLHAVRPGYVRRAADDRLYEFVAAGHYASVIAPARSGKTSLIASTSARLQNNGYRVAILDLAQIADRDGGTDPGRWYYSIAYRLLRQLRIKDDLQSWWQDKSILSNRQRLVEFYSEIILARIKKPVVIFVDELQTIEELQFSEHLLASIRAAHNARSTEPEFSRLTFVVCGECDPQTLAGDQGLSPFAIMRTVRLDDFSRKDLDTFVAELNLDAVAAKRATDRIWYWTSGQPYLTQKLARSVARERLTGDIEAAVDRIARQQLAGRNAIRNEPHMGHIHRRAIEDRRDAEGMLNAYGRLQKGIVVEFDPDSRAHRKLIAIGLVVTDDEGNLRVRNRLYEAVFTARWANEHLPLHWRGPAIAAGLLLLATAIPFWYTQLLPKPYMRVLTSATVSLDSAADAHVNLRSFPGHADTADRLFANLLAERARSAADEATMQRIANHAGRIPGRDGYGRELTAAWWDDRARLAMRNEDRDTALVASLEALVLPTPERRRIARSLVGDDYPYLIGSVAAPRPGAFLFNPENQLLSSAAGARITQWTLVNRNLLPREPWVVSALEITPLLRRVVVDQAGAVSRISLTVNVSHNRLDDIRMRLVAPSGRTVELEFDQPRSAANESIRFAQGELAAMAGEALTGTWTLSLRDEAAGIAGHLVGWNLSLNGQVMVESFERGIDIPQPLERESDNLWFSADGRYAVARALQSDSARLWDLAYAQPDRTIAVPAREQVLGLSGDALHLVTTAQNVVHVWDTASGRRTAELDVGAALEIRLLDDGTHLLVSRSRDDETVYELWDLDAAAPAGTIAVAGVPALHATDASGSHLAVADYDRTVRIWNFRSGELTGQLALHAQPSGLTLSPGGGHLGVLHGDQGVSLWRTDAPDEPLMMNRTRDIWHMAFSASGNWFVAGTARLGFQVYRAHDGTASGAPLGSGLAAGGPVRLAFTRDDRVLLTADGAGMARFWQLPRTPASGDRLAASAGLWQWRESDDLVAAISPGGQRLAIGDSEGHVHVLDAAPGGNDPGVAADELGFLGHAGEVTRLAFSADGALVASAGDDGTVRIWDAVSGLPRPFRAAISVGDVARLGFSPSGRRLAVLSDQRVWLINTDSGAILASNLLGSLHADAAFADDDRLFLAGQDGALRVLVADRLGNWSLRDVWQGQSAIRRIRVAAARELLVMADASNAVQVFDIRNGSIGGAVLNLPDAVSGILTNADGTHVLLRTSRWIHRADLARNGLYWQAAVRAPQTLPGSRMAFDVPAIRTAGEASRENEGILLLTRDAGYAEIAELDFSFSEGPMLFGDRAALLEEWRARLGLR